MFKMGVIEESLENKNVLNLIKPYFFSQRIEEVPEDEVPVWHTNEYHVPEDKIEKILLILVDSIKLTWYIHAFNNEKLYVVLKDRCFLISQHRDNSWDEMIEYGVKFAQVERRFLENIPLHV